MDARFTPRLASTDSPRPLFLKAFHPRPPTLALVQEEPDSIHCGGLRRAKRPKGCNFSSKAILRRARQRDGGKHASPGKGRGDDTSRQGGRFQPHSKQHGYMYCHGFIDVPGRNPAAATKPSAHAVATSARKVLCRQGFSARFINTAISRHGPQVKMRSCASHSGNGIKAGGVACIRQGLRRDTAAARHAHRERRRGCPPPAELVQAGIVSPSRATNGPM